GDAAIVPLWGRQVQPALWPLAGSAWAGGGARVPAALDCAAAIVGAYQSSRVRPAVFLRRHLGPQRRSRTHRRRPRAAEAPGGAELQRRQCVGSVNPQLVKTQGIEKCERKHENGKKISGICKVL